MGNVYFRRLCIGIRQLARKNVLSEVDIGVWQEETTSYENSTVIEHLREF